MKKYFCENCYQKVVAINVDLDFCIDCGFLLNKIEDDKVKGV